MQYLFQIMNFYFSRSNISTAINFLTFFFFSFFYFETDLFFSLRCLEITGADGVMSSEGLLGNPKMFSEEGDRMFFEDFARSQLQTADDFLVILQSHKLPRPLFQVVRSHLFKILYRFSDAPGNTDLRNQLANGNFEEMKDVVTKLHERMSVINYDTNIGMEQGLIGGTNWYYRHRDEKAFNRINSIPRKKKSPIDLTEIKPKKEISTEEMNTKLALLKLKLTERKSLQNTSDKNISSPSSVKQNYASFMSKN